MNWFVETISEYKLYVCHQPDVKIALIVFIFIARIQPKYVNVPLMKGTLQLLADRIVTSIMLALTSKSKLSIMRMHTWGLITAWTLTFGIQRYNHSSQYYRLVFLAVSHPHLGRPWILKVLKHLHVHLFSIRNLLVTA